MRPDLHEIEAQVLEAMSRVGIEPREPLIIDGARHRMRINNDRGAEKSGAYCVFSDNHPAGWFMDWRGGEQISWRFKPDGGSPLAGVTNYHPSSLERAEAEAIRQKENAEKLERAWSAYQKAKPAEEAPDRPYLQHKCITPRGGFLWRDQWCGLRTGSMASAAGREMDNILLIPMMDVGTEQFIALHRVFARPNADGKFSKGWATSAGGVYPIGSDLTRSMVICCEGIATGLALYELWSVGLGESVTVLCLMDAGNLARQALAIRDHHRGRELYVAIDDDPAGRKAGAACMSAGFSGILEPPRGERE